MQFHTSISSKKEAWLKKILDEASLRRRSDVFAFAEWALVAKPIENFGGSLAVSLSKGGGIQMKSVFFRTNILEPALEFEADWEVGLEKEAMGDLKKSAVVANRKIVVAVAKAKILAFSLMASGDSSGASKREVKKAILAWLEEEGVDLAKALCLDEGSAETRMEAVGWFVDSQAKLCVDYEARRYLNDRSKVAGRDPKKYRISSIGDEA